MRCPATTPGTQAGGAFGVLPALLFGCVVERKPDLIEFHEREAARYKRLLANTTTPALKARLAAKAKEREDLAESLEHRENGEARLKRALARS
jgi:hypothetical protein